MHQLRYSREDFGYLVVFPDGSIDLYGEAVASLLPTASTRAHLEPHRLDKLQVRGDFHLASPLIVWLEVTRGCNLRCSHCYINAGRVRDNELSTGEMFALLDDLKELGAFALVLAGGEPYLRPDFNDILSYVEKLDFVTAVVTNGSFLTPEALGRFPKKNCRITLSVDGL
jgi:MoaA/NifB/PqqE/SkfB family radical SAM enzyme